MFQTKFYKSSNGKEPVRNWICQQDKADKKTLGEDIKTLQEGWPMGMPFVRKMEKGLWELRSNISGKRIARIFFTVTEGNLVLLHAIIKKKQKTPLNDLAIARKRKEKSSA